MQKPSPKREIKDYPETMCWEQDKKLRIFSFTQLFPSEFEENDLLGKKPYQITHNINEW